MKAIQVSSYGEPDVLETVNVEQPSMKSTEVLIEVHCAGINYKDTMLRKNQYVYSPSLPYIPGEEVAGIVKEVGSEVTGVKRGERVVALAESGGYAEYVAVDYKKLVSISETIDFSTAVALPRQGLTAYHVLKTMGRLKEGETVLIHAAAGGVGSIAVQLARQFGAKKIIATASTEEKLAYVKRLGADVCINYTKLGWENKVKEATEDKGVDVALEMVGGDIFDKTLMVLGDFGRLIVYGFASGKPGELTAAQLIGKNQTVSGFFLEEIIKYPKLVHSSLDELFSYLQDGKLLLQTEKIIPLNDAAQAHQLIEERKTKGKIILEVKA